MNQEDEEEQGYESGPFCRHWSDPTSCDEQCGRCGHFCRHHDHDGECADCNCTEWVET